MAAGPCASSAALTALVKSRMHPKQVRVEEVLPSCDDAVNLPPCCLLMATEVCFRREAPESSSKAGMGKR